jgi:hypothetical protein
MLAALAYAGGALPLAISLLAFFLLCHGATSCCCPAAGASQQRAPRGKEGWTSVGLQLRVHEKLNVQQNMPPLFCG